MGSPGKRLQRLPRRLALLRSDRWRLPLFSLPAMGYPEGGSVLFNDALPLTALPSKVIYRLTGVLINPFGWWILLTYVLQGVMAAKVMLSAGVRSISAPPRPPCSRWLRRRSSPGWGTRPSRRISSAVGHQRLFLLAPPTPRETCRVRGFPGGTLLTNAYLFAMVFALVVVTAFALWGAANSTSAQQDTWGSAWWASQRSACWPATGS